MIRLRRNVSDGELRLHHSGGCPNVGIAMFRHRGRVCPTTEGAGIRCDRCLRLLLFCGVPSAKPSSCCARRGLHLWDVSGDIHSSWTAVVKSSGHGCGDRSSDGAQVRQPGFVDSNQSTTSGGRHVWTTESPENFAGRLCLLHLRRVGVVSNLSQALHGSISGQLDKRSASGDQPWGKAIMGRASGPSSSCGKQAAA